MRTHLPKGKRHSSPCFSAHVYCGQTAGWIRIPLGTEVGLGPGDIVIDEDLATSMKRGTVHLCGFRHISISGLGVGASLASFVAVFAILHQMSRFWTIRSCHAHCHAPFRPRLSCLPGEVTATAWLPTCDVVSARQCSYPVSALSGMHLPGKSTVWRR